MRPWNPNTKSTSLPGIEPRLLRQTVPVGAHCVSAHWATEAGSSNCRSIGKFPENLAKPVPECWTIMDFIASGRCDNGGDNQNS